MRRGGSGGGERKGSEVERSTEGTRTVGQGGAVWCGVVRCGNKRRECDRTVTSQKVDMEPKHIWNI